MSFREKIRLRLPAYLIFSFLGFLGLLSLWMPGFIGKIDTVDAALTYSATTTVVRAPNDSHNRMVSVGGTYYLAFTSSTTGAPTSTCGPSGSCNLYFTSSSNGVNWSAPVLINSGLSSDDGNNVASPLGGLIYDSRNGFFSITYKRQTDGDIYIATSTNGLTWRGGAVVNGTAGSQSAASGRVYIASATSTNLMAMAYRKEGYIYVATSTNTSGALSSWSSTTPANIGYTYDGNGYQAEAVGVNIESTSTINVIYVAATSTQIQYVSMRSVNSGRTWTTSSISGPIAPISTDLLSSSVRGATTAQMPNGRLALLYRDITGADMSGYPTSITLTSKMVYAVQNSGGTWATSSFSSGSTTIAITDTVNFFTEHPALTIFNANQPAGIFYATSSYLALSVNTSTVVTETVTTDVVSQSAGMSVALNTTTRQLGMVYVSGYQLRFVSTSLRDTSWNVAPTTTAFTHTFSTTGTGHVTFSIGVNDPEADTTSLLVEYSLDDVTWASSTIIAANASTGSVTASTGLVSGISTNSTNTITMVWDTKADGVTSTADIAVRIIPFDQYTVGLTIENDANIDVDNVAPAVPDFTSVTVSSSTIDLVWDSVSGASEYTVSSSAGGTVLTPNATSSYSDLSPNTLYSYQVRSVDEYGNTSTFSSATSTYTDPVAPGTPSASASGATSMSVSWSANSNGSGTVYQLYNVTSDALVATTTAVSYSVTGLTANTSYQFRVRAQYLANSASTTDYSATSTAASTNAESSSSSGGSSSGGSAASAPAAPVLPPAPTPFVAPAPTVAVFPVGASKQVTIGSESHTVTVQNANETSVTFELRSKPVIVNLVKGQAVSISTNNDDAKEVVAEYLGMVSGQPQIKLTSLLSIPQNSAAFTINGGASETNNQAVRLEFNVTGAAQIAIASESDFAGAVFQPYQKTINWNLSAGSGLKTLYARFRTADGGVTTLQDTITLTGSYVPVVEQSPVSIPTEPAAPSTYQFAKNLYAGSKGGDVTELQNRLKSLGHFTDTPTGFYGNATMAAVKKYQAANGIQQTGGVGPATRAALNRGVAAATTTTKITVPSSSGYKFTQNLYMGARSAAVTELQNRLKSLGHFTDTPTGFYGNATMAAVKKYQAANGIQQTGGVGPATRAALNQ